MYHSALCFFSTKTFKALIFETISTWPTTCIQPHAPCTIEGLWPWRDSKWVRARWPWGVQGGMPAARSLHHVSTLSPQQSPLHRMSHRCTTLPLDIFGYYTKIFIMHCKGKRRLEHSIGAADGRSHFHFLITWH